MRSKLSLTALRAANLRSPTEGHMHHLTLKLVDPTHLTQEWTWQENGQTHATIFQFARKS